MKNAMKNDLLNLPSPSKISFFWNFGSILGLMLGMQLVSGIFLAFSFLASALDSFSIVDLIVRDFKFGYIMRTIHANGASFYFLFIYFHMFRGIFFGSYKKSRKVWFIGLSIFSLSMATAFLGYVLPWGKMSFWAATVITNLFSALPRIGDWVVNWLLGGFSVSTPTLTRFFYAHVLLPFVMFGCVLVHMLSLHSKGSSNPIGLSGGEWINFHPFFSFKDLYGMFFVMIFFSFFCLFFPYMIMDSDKFKEASALKTPAHMQPEWYFLPAYTVLRSVPSKLGGVLGLVFFVLVYYTSPLFSQFKKIFKKNFFFRSYIFWLWLGMCLGLLYMGMCGVDGWYLFLGRFFSLGYFFLLWMIFSMK